MPEGYYRTPTLHGNTVVFACEDDLWTVPTEGGTARRLTAYLGEASHPALSPDGRTLAFTGREEGPPEVFLMPAEGGAARRLTFLGANLKVVGWEPDGNRILFASNAQAPFARMQQLFALDPAGGAPERLRWGPAQAVAFGPATTTGARPVVLGRNTADPARWKRYRGGTAGDLWIDQDGTGTFRKLVELQGNLAAPMWVGDSVYFLSDHEGIGNLYSCAPDGTHLRRHTHLDTYYARTPATDGHRIVFTAGAELYLLDPAADRVEKLAVDFHSSRTQRMRKFVDAARFLESAAIHPQGHSLALATRGRPFVMGNWGGPVVQHGRPDGARYRLPVWLADGKQLVAVTDEAGEEGLVLFSGDGSTAPRRFDLALGRVVELAPSPEGRQVAVANHRHELFLVTLPEEGEPELRLVERNPFRGVQDLAWSRDGRWLAYTWATSRLTSAIRVCRAETGACEDVTDPILQDVAPAFDPEGRYLYFLSRREFRPVSDNLHFELGFPRGMRPYLVTLRPDVASPFLPCPEAPGGTADEDAKDETTKDGEARGPETKPKGPKPVEIDFAGIRQRILAFPVPEGLYGQVRGLSDKVLFTSLPIPGGDEDEHEHEGTGSLMAYDLADRKAETLVDGVGSFEVSRDGKVLLYRAGKSLRVLKAGAKPKEGAADKPGKESGWIDLSRIKVSLSPEAEWGQMYREAWRLQRDQFWTEDMSAVDWQHVHDRYLPQLMRVGTRSELSDLLWEMQGELGTSHAYELGGDYRSGPRYDQGLLAAQFSWNATAEGYRILEVVHGDPWEEGHDSPLNRAGLNLSPDEVLVAVNGQAVTEHLAPHELLVHQANALVQLTLRSSRGLRTVAVKALGSEFPARYREWVEGNRARVHAASGGRAGYVHIPDMGSAGFAEFHRGFLAESQRDALLVDVRYNGGGNVSQLILEKLARRRVGYDLPRYGEPEPYPSYAVAGPMVALTNEHAGSDGDIFCHCFKLMKLGPLLGRRTWGGVIGIWPRHALVDGTMTTQPEFSFWFEDVGWSVENHGTAPDREVDALPQDWAKGTDTQLEEAIAELLRQMEARPPVKPSFGERPRLALPGR